jgi:hypothetical protein
MPNANIVQTSGRRTGALLKGVRPFNSRLKTLFDGD